MIYPRENPTPLEGGKLQTHLYFDSMADFPDLPNFDRRAAPGSDAFCVDTSDAYILNSVGVWEVL